MDLPQDFRAHPEKVFRIEKDHIGVFKETGRFAIIGRPRYTLPSVNPYDLPQSEHSCRVCQKSFIQKRGPEAPQETPVVMSCGHIAGSSCLEFWCSLRSVPRCFVCDRVLILNKGVDPNATPQPNGPTTFPAKSSPAQPSLASRLSEISSEIHRIQQLLARSLSNEDIEAALTLLGINEANFPARGCSVGDVQAALELLGLSKSPAENTGLTLSPKPQSTSKQHMVALERLNQQHGTAVSLEELEVMLGLFNSVNDTKTTSSDALVNYL